jgi:cytochrome P450
MEHTVKVSEVARCPVQAGYDVSQEFLGDPGAALGEARRSCPVFFDNARNTWVVTRYDDVRRVLTDHEAFSSKAEQTPVVPPPEFSGRLPQHDIYAKTVLFLDPPEHTRVRKLMNRTFTRKRVSAQDPHVRAVANDVIDGLVDAGRCDLMYDFALPVLWRVAVGMFGIPENEIERMKALQADMFALLLETKRAEDVAVRNHDLWLRIADGYDYFRGLLDERRASPKDDLSTVLLEATNDDGSPAFTDDEIVVHTMGTLSPLTNTTSVLVCNCVVLLDEHPEAAAAVRQDRETINIVIEEAMRRYPPSVTAARIATREVALAGTTIPAGATVWASLASANHDEEHYSDPESFKVDRDNLRGQLGFGLGRHFCLGAPLARVAARAAVETLYERLPRLRLPEQELVWLQALSRQPKSLIAEWGV